MVERERDREGRGLQNEGIYYVVVVDNDTIKLSNSYYYSSRKERNIVNITTTSSGSILPVNPPIELVSKNTLVFDLSSSSLSFTNNWILYSAFDFDFYTDSDFKHKFNFTNSKNIEVVKEGRVGIDTNAKVSLRLNDLGYYINKQVIENKQLNILIYRKTD